MDFIESCRLFVHHPRNTEFSGNFLIQCEGTCYIVQASEEKLLFSKDLTITATSIHVNFMNIEVGQNLIATAGVSGNLLFHSVKTGHAAVLSTAEGDALYQSTEEFQVSWSNHSNLYCLGTFGVFSQIEAPTNCWVDDATQTSFQTTSTCRGSYRLCRDVCNNTGASVTLIAPQGSVIANVIEATGAVLGTSAQSISSAEYNNDFIHSNPLLTTALLNAQTSFQKTDRGDNVFLIDVGSFLVRDSASMRILVTPN